MEAEVPTDEKDINSLYEDAIHVLNTKPPKVDSKPDQGTQQEDYYRTFRTKCVFLVFLWGVLRGLLMYLFFSCSVLLAWVLSNSLLAAAITSTNSKASDGGANKAVTGYMAFLLASVAGLACEFFPSFCVSSLVAVRFFIPFSFFIRSLLIF